MDLPDGADDAEDIRVVTASICEAGAKQDEHDDSEIAVYSISSQHSMWQELAHYAALTSLAGYRSYCSDQTPMKYALEMEALALFR